MSDGFASAQDLEEYLQSRGVLVGRQSGGLSSLESLSPTSCRVRRWPGDDDVRRGSLTGPMMFLAADAAALVMTLSRLPRGSDAVTSSATITFLQRPALGPLVGEARLLRAGGRLMVSDVSVIDEGGAEVAHALITCSPLLADPGRHK
jgi:acyl-coenzyme A thioesterase PaaI-like protein